MDLAGFLISILIRGSLYGIDDPILVTFCLFILAVSVYGRWHLFKKAGQAPWKAAVPVLQDYVLYDIAWDGRYGILHVIFNMTYALLLPGNGGLLSSGPLGFVCVISFIIMFVISSIMKCKLARSFGRSVSTAFCLIFMDFLFIPILGLGKSKYYGKTLRKYNDPDANISLKLPKVKFSHRYSIDLDQRHSIIALIAGLVVSVCAFRAVAGGLMTAPSEITPERGSSLYRLFTVNSNTLAAFGAVLMIPYAVEGIRNKRFVLPKWIAMFQYAGAICTTLTMLFAVFLIWPGAGAKLAFTGMNFWLHVICPIMSLVLLYTVESYNHFSNQDALLALTPFDIYAVIYIFNVVLLGPENGGWRDIYRLTIYLPATISAPLMFMFGFGIATLIRVLYNRLSEYRHNRMIKSLWSGLTPVELKIEVFGLGRYKGLHNDEDSINFPVDIFRTINRIYGIPIESLSTAYAKGVSDGLKERKHLKNITRQRVHYIIGTPEYLSKEYLASHPDAELPRYVTEN